MDDAEIGQVFALFNEIGIVEQLASTLFETHLPDGLLVSHFAVLNGLVRVRDGRTPLELARAYQVPKTTMTHTLAGLQARGLIEFRPNPSDGRSKCVWITDDGRAVRLASMAALSPRIERLGGAIDVPRLLACLPALAELRAYLDAERDGAV